jgi:hypothetical protein
MKRVSQHTKVAYALVEDTHTIICKSRGQPLEAEGFEGEQYPQNRWSLKST